jgi:hypothetical protein
VVAVRISREVVEVGALAPAVADVGRIDAEVATPLQDTTTGRTEVSRMVVEVCGRNPGTARVTRLDAEVATPLQATTTGRAEVSRLSMEVGARNLKTAAMSRLDAEVATPLQAATTGRVRVSRLVGEVTAHRGSSGPVEPLAVPAGWELFLHDWADDAVLRSSYSTDVSSAPATGAESRRGLVSKPDRTISLRWHLHADDDAQRARIDRLLVMLRKITDERGPIPLYMDQKEIPLSYLTSDDTVFFDTSKGRYFIGGRVAIVQMDYRGVYASHTFHLISTVQDDRLVFTTTLGVAVPAGSIIIPMMDCEVTLEATSKSPTARNMSVQIEMSEVAGPSQLPPVKTDFPTNAQSHADAPIFDFQPDWLEGIEKGRNRQGQSYKQGRANRVYKAAARSRETHKLKLTGLRGDCADRPLEDIWRVVEFWDTRRGRLRSFWLVDQEQVWEMESIDASGNFLGISEFGDFADFQAELQGGWIGLVMDDGTVYVRDAVTVQQVLTVYRVTLSPVLPPNLDFRRVVRVARARRTRFLSDELEERWSNAGFLSVTLDFLEVLEEKNVST